MKQNMMTCQIKNCLYVAKDDFYFPSSVLYFFPCSITTEDFVMSVPFGIKVFDGVQTIWSTN